MLALEVDRTPTACHDCAVLSEGKQIALRREALGWKQQVLADKASVGIATLVRIEKDRNVRVDRLRAVLAALEKEEKRRGVTSPVRPVSTNDGTMKEGADDLEALSIDVRNIELMFERGLTELRRIRLDLDRRIARRKSG